MKNLLAATKKLPAAIKELPAAIRKSLPLLLLLLPLTATAQSSRDLLISEITGGTAWRQSGRERVELQQSQHIMSQDILIIPEGITMILLEPKDCKRYTVKGSYTGTIRNYIQRNEQACTKIITTKYMNYLIAQTFRAQKKTSGRYEDGHATVFREGDSMLDSMTVSIKSIDSLYHTIDSLSVPPSDTISRDSIRKVPTDSIKVLLPNNIR